MDRLTKGDRILTLVPCILKLLSQHHGLSSGSVSVPASDPVFCASYTIITHSLTAGL